MTRLPIDTCVIRVVVFVLSGGNTVPPQANSALRARPALSPEEQNQPEEATMSVTESYKTVTISDDARMAAIYALSAQRDRNREWLLLSAGYFVQIIENEIANATAAIDALYAARPAEPA